MHPYLTESEMDKIIDLIIEYFKKMIDFNHFIYNLDDGPSSIEESMDMLHHAILKE